MHAQTSSKPRGWCINPWYDQTTSPRMSGWVDGGANAEGLPYGTQAKRPGFAHVGQTHAEARPNDGTCSGL